MSCSRRDFLGLSCGGYVAYMLGAGSSLTRHAFGEEPAGPVVKEKWAYVQKIADGVWVTTSTPMQPGGGLDPTTISNGGIIAGKDAVMVIEGFMQTKGAAWQSEVAKQLTGRYPTHVVLTHYHADHSAGLAGYQRGAEGPGIIGTRTMRKLLVESPRLAPQAEEGKPFAKAEAIRLPDLVLAKEDEATVIDLGGRKVTLTPRNGHTDSDITISIDEPRMVWCGDLYFNGLFPFYGDATPTKLDKTVSSLIDESHSIYVPGHGPNSDKKTLSTYRNMLRHVGEAAQKAVKAGTPASEAWKAYQIPDSLGQWGKFRPDVYRFAFEAWERELKGK